MQISKVLIIACFAGAAAGPIHSQPASSDSQGKALELLRQAIAQGQTEATEAKPAAPDQQQQALQLLRQKIAEEQPVSAKSSSGRTNPAKSAKPAPASKTTKATAAASTPNAAAAQPGVSASPAAPGSATPAAPDQPAGPKTKQQRLAELADQYKTDKITPAEYYAQRAKILAEP